MKQVISIINIYRIIKKEGTVALFRSYPTTIILGIPYSAIMLPINEYCKKIMNPTGKLVLK